MKPGKTGLARIIDAAGYSSKGLKAAWTYEAAFRQELIMGCVLFIAAMAMPVAHLERVLLIASVVLVVIVELINSALEAVVDRVGDEWHELSGRAKDIGSAAVLISILLSLFIWLSIIIEML